MLVIQACVSERIVQRSCKSVWSPLLVDLRTVIESWKPSTETWFTRKREESRGGNKVSSESLSPWQKWNVKGKQR